MCTYCMHRGPGSTSQNLPSCVTTVEVLEMADTPAEQHDCSPVTKTSCGVCVQGALRQWAACTTLSSAAVSPYNSNGRPSPILMPTSSSRPLFAIASTIMMAKNPIIAALPLIFSAQFTNPNFASGSSGFLGGRVTPSGTFSAVVVHCSLLLNTCLLWYAVRCLLLVKALLVVEVERR